MTTRPYIGVRFDCCGIYLRIYRRPDQSEYLGRCPHCLREVRVQVGPEGVAERFFVAE